MDVPSPHFRRLARFVSPVDRGFAVIVYAGSAVFVLLIAGLFVELVLGSWPSILKFGIGFIFSGAWDPVANKFGALPMIYGTVVTSAIAIVLAAFVGIMAAVFLADFAPRWLAQPLLVLDRTAGGGAQRRLWACGDSSCSRRSCASRLDRCSKSFSGGRRCSRGQIYGVGLLTAGIILALMIVPTVTAISRDVIVAIQRDLREASMALGATKWETAVRVVLPAARTGIFGACVLALGRALGETIAVTMVIGNRPQISASLFAPSYTLASVIANEFTEATNNLYISALIELGLILFFVSIIVNALARLLIWNVRGARG